MFIDFRVAKYIQKEKLERAQARQLAQQVRPSFREGLASTLQRWARRLEHTEEKMRLGHDNHAGVTPQSR